MYQYFFAILWGIGTPSAGYRGVSLAIPKSALV